MLFRAQVRTTAIQLLQAAITQQGSQFFTSKDTPVEAGLTPSIIVYTDDRKTGQGGTPPQFRTEVLTTVEVTVEGDDKDAAETNCDSLCEIVENTLLGDPTFVKLFEGIDSVETHEDYRGTDTERHTFTAVIEIKAHVSEVFEPSITTPLAGINIYVDSVRPFDPNGVEVPPFNYEVADAPRAAGPDGRVEASGKLDIPQE